ncbi:MAG: hypothetical protein JXR84_03055 [Anaerolineae bacterium]|nr:hypothetical protein [Anaerolineae bacterium]
MNTLEAVRDAQQMWEWKFQNAGRERIVLNSGRRGGLATLAKAVSGIFAVKSSRKAPVRLVGAH